MKARARLGCFALGAALTLAAPGAVGDVYMKQVRRTDPFTVMGQTQPAKTGTVVTWLGDRCSRVDGEEGLSSLMCRDAPVAYLVNHGTRTYAEMPLEVRTAIGEEMAESPEEEREAVQAMQGMAQAMLKFETRVTPTEERKTVGRWTARKYLMETRAGMGVTRSELWATEDVKVDPSGYWQAANATLASQPGFEGMLKEMQKVKGVVVLNVSRSEVMGATVTTTEELVEVAERPAPPGTYEVPAGYRKAKGVFEDE